MIRSRPFTPISLALLPSSLSASVALPFTPLANELASRSSSLSAFRLATLTPELTFMGALPASTCSSRAVAAALVELLSIWRLGPATLPTSLLRVFTVFVWPRLKVAPTPVPASATELRPNTNASVSATPHTIAMPLASIAAFERAFVISCHPFFLGGGILAPPLFGYVGQRIPRTWGGTSGEGPLFV